MGRSSDIRARRRATALTILVMVLLLLFPAAAAAVVDGVPLYPPGIDSAYSMTSMEDPDLSGPMLAVEAFYLGDPGATEKSQTAAIVGWNAATGLNWPIGQDGQTLADGADQRQPTVLDVDGDVYVAWQQLDDPVTATWDLWLWRGSEKGTPRAGYPKVVARGPASSNQRSPDLGVTTDALGRTRSSPGSTTATPPAPPGRSTGWTSPPTATATAPATSRRRASTHRSAGERLDPSGDLLKGQHDPAVGRDGIFWLDDRSAATAGESEVWRADLSSGLPAGVQVFQRGPDDNKEKLWLRAGGPGAAWLGPGIAGGPWEPWARVPGGEARIVTFLANPTAFDVAGPRFAVSAGHGGNTDGDGDIFLYDQTTGQSTPVCNVGGTKTFAFDRLKIQTTPSISSAPGGSRVVWCDSRQFRNTASTPVQSLAYELYVALVPKVTLDVTYPGGKPLHRALLKATVTPDFAGKEVLFQGGTRHEASTRTAAASGTATRQTIATRTLVADSKAAYLWSRPQGRSLLRARRVRRRQEVHRRGQAQGAARADGERGEDGRALSGGAARVRSLRRRRLR